jgi:hypothetical protein
MHRPYNVYSGMQDSRLMRTARWLIDQLDSDLGDGG